MRTDPPNEYRIRAIPILGTTDADGMNGFFVIPLRQFGRVLIADCIVSDGTDCADGRLKKIDPSVLGWEHVSVKIHDRGKLRIPEWREMCAIKDIFWKDDECVVQYHPPKKDYVNFNPHVLHMWRKVDGSIPTPPKICV